MKKIFIFIMILVLNVSLCDVSYAEYNPDPLNMKPEMLELVMDDAYGHAMGILMRQDIVRDPSAKWEKGDFIKRRNAFEMAYIVSSYGFRYLEEIKVADEQHMYSDVEPCSYDNALTVSLNRHMFIFNGTVNQEGQKLARLDDYLTYYEAFAIISRLLTYGRRYFDNRDTKNNIGEDEDYYRLMCDIGLVNSNTLINYSSVTVAEDDIHNNITAYEFMLLLSKAIYVPHLMIECYGSVVSDFTHAEALSWFPSRFEVIEYEEEDSAVCYIITN